MLNGMAFFGAERANYVPQKTLDLCTPGDLSKAPFAGQEKLSAIANSVPKNIPSSPVFEELKPKSRYEYEMEKVADYYSGPGRDIARWGKVGEPAVRLLLPSISAIEGGAHLFVGSEKMNQGDYTGAKDHFISAFFSFSVANSGNPNSVFHTNMAGSGTGKVFAYQTGSVGFSNVNSGFQTFTYTNSVYNPRGMEAVLRNRYGTGNVSSKTLPMMNEKNVKLANMEHPATGVPFDGCGFPVFDKYVQYDTRIASKYFSVKNDAAHMRAATRDLRENIKHGKVDSSQFTPAQLKAIQKGSRTIPNYRWHHHQDTGRMQLVPSYIHDKTGHIGGYQMWFR